MSTYDEDIEIFNLIFRIASIRDELGLNKENLKPYLVSVEKKKVLEEEKEKLSDKYWHLLIDIDRIRIRDWPDEKAGADFIRKFMEFDIDELWDDYYEYILESYEDCEVLDRYAFSKNYLKLKPPYVRIGTKIPEGIKNIYHESRWCYVYGQYNASIALSRTVIETVLINNFNLEGDLNSIIDLAKKKNLISAETFWKIDKVRRSANKILHQAKLKSEKEAKNSVDHVLDFLEEIYFE